jgi:hypothetical protein
MSTARHHAEWLSLLEVSGPFLSLPVLIRVFPNELEARDADQAQELKLAYADWTDRGERDATVHRLWVRYVLDRVLGYGSGLLAEGAAIPPGMEARMAEYGETLRPDFAVVHRAAGVEKPEIALLVQVYPATQKLDSPVKDRSWKASPDTRMAELLHGADIALGLVTNGERWMLVHAPRGETTGFASWYADLWMQEPLALRSFYSLLNCQRLLGVAVGDRLVDLLGESAKDQQEVTEQLGYQVRRAVEVFVQALDKIDQDTNRELLKDVPEREIYNGALTVMMRLVFLFKAEELGLLLLGEELYDANFAVSTLRDQLRERADQHGEEILERRSDAWCRLLTTFRAVYAGTEHDALRLPPYGGTLLDPDRFPFLEGRKSNTSWREVAAQPLAINNRVVLHLLEALQILRIKIPGGGPAEPRRLSFRSLDIEQIGHVYEGLLDHTAKRANEVVLGLSGSRDSESEIPLSTVEAISAGGLPKLLDYLEDKTRRSRRALERALATENLPDDNRLGLAVGGDLKIIQRLRAYVGLLREDSFGQLVVIRPGDVYVTSGSDRRSTGTHYTPRSLTEPIVQYTLEPLVYRGPAECIAKEQWQLKSPKEILAIKICDMAMGSGAFLVQACRFLADHLVEAWEKIERANVDHVIVTPEGDLSKGSPTERLLPVDQAERITIARRFIADRCLYGVDINPMAVEMAKLSLWLITLQRDRPFTFLDHALKCGDSLLGVSSVRQIENFSLRPGERQVTFATANLFRYVEAATVKRRALEDLPSNDHTQIQTKNRLHAEAEAATAKVKALADCLIAFELRGLDGDAYEDQRTDEAEKVQLLMKRDADASLKSPISNFQSALATHTRDQLRGRRPFHWAVEFPEVTAKGGFDAFVGNPPFLGGRRISYRLSSELLTYLKSWLNGPAGTTDLCVYFLRRACILLGQQGFIGFVLSDIISQGESRTNGLEYLLSSGFSVYNSISSRDWPGQAGVKIAHLHITPTEWVGDRVLNGESVSSINAYLQQAAACASPEQLNVNDGLCFSGHYLMGQGFVLSPEQARELLSRRPANRKVIFPYIRGDDINNNVAQASGFFAINFSMRELDECRENYPECLELVRLTVKPERDLVKRSANRERWWRYAEARPGLEKAVEELEQVIVQPFTAKYVLPTFVSSKCVFAHPLVVIVKPSFFVYAFLQSTIHEKWVWQHCSTSLDLFRYTASSVLETFPFPSFQEKLAKLGELYYTYRQGLIVARNEELTRIYNRFHDRGEQSADIARLRALHEEIDQAVAAAYGWSDLDLGHGFHATKQGERYTLSESARRSVLDRLLALNHQRYAEELKEGLHDKGSKAVKNGARRKVSSSLPMQQTLIPDAQRELF